MTAIAAILIIAIYFGIWQLLSIFIYYNAWMLWLSFRLRGTATPPPSASVDEWPFVTVQLPVYNEPSVVSRLVKAVGDINYPADRFEVQLLDDSTDLTSQIAKPIIKSLNERGINVQHLRRNNREGYKAGALREGLKSAKGDFILILDADFVPKPDILKQMIPWFHSPDIAMVQARWGNLAKPRSLIERCTAYWIDRHFEIEQVARSRSNQFFHFNGSGGIWRRAAIEDSGGWSADTVAEDMDLSFRAWFRRWRFIYDHTVVVPADQPPDMRALKIQQGRWAQGTFQVARKVMPTLRDLPLRTRSTIGLHLTGYTFPVMLLAVGLLSGPSAWALLQLPKTVTWLTLIPVGGFLAGFLAQVVYRWCSQGLRAGLLELEAMVVGLGLSPHIGRHLIRGLISTDTEFRRTPKTPATEGSLDIFLWLDALLVLVLVVNVIYVMSVGMWLAVPVPAFTAIGIFYSMLASAFPRLGSAVMAPEASAQSSA